MNSSFSLFFRYAIFLLGITFLLCVNQSPTIACGFILTIVVVAMIIIDCKKWLDRKIECVEAKTEERWTQWENLFYLEFTRVQIEIDQTKQRVSMLSRDRQQLSAVRPSLTSEEIRANGTPPLKLTEFDLGFLKSDYRLTFIDIDPEENVIHLADEECPAWLREKLIQRSCKFNAKSELLKCTANPSGTCSSCLHYEGNS